MTQGNTLSAGAAAIVLSLGVAGQGTIPKELQIPLGNKDIVIVKDEARPSLGQTGGHRRWRASRACAVQSRSVCNCRPRLRQKCRPRNASPNSRIAVLSMQSPIVLRSAAVGSNSF
jgi:hypothetical protein